MPTSTSNPKISLLLSTQQPEQVRRVSSNELLTSTILSIGLLQKNHLGHLDVVRHLLKSGGARVDDAGSANKTPLYAACVKGRDYYYSIISRRTFQ